MLRFLLLVGAILFHQTLATAFTASAPAQDKRSAASAPAEAWERSFWLHASLGEKTLRGYWGTAFPANTAPSPEEIRRAAKLLTDAYAADRLYLIYHLELPIEEAEAMFLAWRAACPRTVDLVPTLVLRMYDRENTPVFSAQELVRLANFFRDRLGSTHLGIYDVYPDRDQEEYIRILEKHFPGGLVRVGVQPDEKIEDRYAWAVQDTWSGFCHGKTNEDWLAPGFGADTLRNWIQIRAKQATAKPVSWDLIVVAWDYAPTERGEYPGYDDAKKNMPLPAGRNRLALREIMNGLPSDRFKGVSSDLFILQANSRAVEHDGAAASFYNTLKKGENYKGYYAEPFKEIVDIYKGLRDNPRMALSTTTRSAP